VRCEGNLVDPSTSTPHPVRRCHLTALLATRHMLSLVLAYQDIAGKSAHECTLQWLQRCAQSCTEPACLQHSVLTSSERCFPHVASVPKRDNFTVSDTLMTILCMDNDVWPKTCMSRAACFRLLRLYQPPKPHLLSPNLHFPSPSLSLLHLCPPLLLLSPPFLPLSLLL
jgi:hypothetical protein